MFNRLSNCHNSGDFRNLAKERIPSAIFHYIDGGADDEATLRQNTKAYENCDLVPSVLKGVEDIDMSVTVMGQKLNLPLFFSQICHYQMYSVFFPTIKHGVVISCICKPN